VRRFDKDLYAELVKPVTGAPSFDEFIKQPGVEQYRRRIVSIACGNRRRPLSVPAVGRARARTHLQSGWKRIAPPNCVERLYHLAAALDPKAQELFEQQFQAPKTVFDSCRLLGSTGHPERMRPSVTA